MADNNSIIQPDTFANCNPVPSTIKDLTGFIFGRLTVIGYSHKQIVARKKFEHYWVVSCSCGTTTKMRGRSLVNRNRSCGCLRKENATKANTKHGLWHNRMYWILRDIIRRCHNSNDKAYKYYGGRGISVCDRWRFGENDKSGIECFVQDMNERPSKNHTVERIDNNKGYSLDNCKWATMKEQGANKRSNVIITFNNKTQSLLEWAKELNLRPGLLHNRRTKGWCVERVLAPITQISLSE